MGQHCRRVGPVGERDVLRFGGAVAARVVTDDAVALREGGCLLVPHAQRAQPARDQQQRMAVALDLEVQPAPGDVHEPHLAHAPIMGSGFWPCKRAIAAAIGRAGHAFWQAQLMSAFHPLQTLGAALALTPKCWSNGHAQLDCSEKFRAGGLHRGEDVNRVRWLALASMIVIIAGVAWYFASPAYTLSRMTAAAEANDSDAMAGYIDFPALREDLKAGLMAQMMVEAQKDHSEFGGLGMALGSAIIGPMVDGFVTPVGLKAAFLASKGRTAAEADPKKQPAGGAFEMKDEPVIKRRGFSEFLVASKEDPDSGMVFKRHGFSWKLSGVVLPPAKP